MFVLINILKNIIGDKLNILSDKWGTVYGVLWMKDKELPVNVKRIKNNSVKEATLHAKKMKITIEIENI